MALANRIDALRAEVVTFIEESRRIQVSALDKAMLANGAEDTLPPVALVIFATSAALSLHREAALGVRTGHAEITAAIGGFIAKWDKKGS